MHVILLHNSNASEALILCASEHYNFITLMEDLPLRGTNKVLVIYFHQSLWYSVFNVYVFLAISLNTWNENSFL